MTPTSDTGYLLQTNTFRYALGSVAFAGGIAYAFAKKTGFWKGWGVAIIFGLIGSGIGTGIDFASSKKA